MHPIKPILFILALATVLAGCSEADVESAQIEPAASAEPVGPGISATDIGEQWASYGSDYSEKRYSPLTQVTADNISELELAWYGDLAERGGSYETTPVVADGRIYVSSPWSKVYAFDAKNGALKKSKLSVLLGLIRHLTILKIY